MLCRRQFLTLAAAAVTGLARPGRAASSTGVVRAAVAHDFATAARKIGAAFSAQPAAGGARLMITADTTERLESRILEGTPFDVFLADDAEAPGVLEGEGLVVPGSRFIYASGQLALWRLKGGVSGGDVAAALGKPSFGAIAIARPDLDPYGDAARETLKSMDLWDALAPRLKRFRSVEAVQEAVEAGQVGAGFVAASAVVGPAARGEVWHVPQTYYAPIRQEAALLMPGAANPAARAFLKFLTGAAAHEIVTAQGFATN